MCLILFAYDVHPAYRLVLLANRDEFYARPTAPAAFWPEAPELLAGRDLVAGGTWLGVSRGGRLAAVTNYRDPSDERHGPSRGLLTRDFLLTTAAPRPFLAKRDPPAGAYCGFNLLFGDGDGLSYYSNRDDGLRPVSAGLYGLSNHLLDTPWPKVTRGRNALARALALPAPLDEDQLLALLADRSMAPDDQLPETGVGPEWERILSPTFIISPRYGTRASSLLLIDIRGHVTFMERRFAADGRSAGEGHFEFDSAAWARPL
jgi:uncharacterized protein with NRDE domain